MGTWSRHQASLVGLWWKKTLPESDPSSVRRLRTEASMFFFFSSRRRHTRLQGDRSSDVCSSDLLRLSPIVGRKKQMIKFKGTTLYPPALFDMLNEMEYIKDYVAEVYSNEIGMDEVKLHLLAVSNNDETDRKIRAYLQAKLRVIPHVHYVTVEEIQKIQ